MEAILVKSSVSNEKNEREIHEQELNNELGLYGQIVKKKIEIIVTNYKQVGREDLHDLFGLTNINKRIKRNYLLKCWSLFILFVPPSTFLFMGMTNFDMSVHSITVCIIGGLFLGGTLFGNLIMHSTGAKQFIIKYINLSEYEGFIPYGAKLKLKEAIDARIFDEFYIAKPSLHLPDPAIIGRKFDKEYLISCWDDK